MLEAVAKRYRCVVLNSLTNRNLRNYTKTIPKMRLLECAILSLIWVTNLQAQSVLKADQVQALVDDMSVQIRQNILHFKAQVPPPEESLTNPVITKEKLDLITSKFAEKAPEIINSHAQHVAHRGPLSTIKEADSTLQHFKEELFSIYDSVLSPESVLVDKR
jgi:hypothetical protein